MSDSRAGCLSLVGGALALDFANTVSERGTPQAVEHLQQPRHVVDWAVHAGAVLPSAEARLREAEAPDGPHLLAEARDLRDAIHALGQALARGRPPPEAEAGVVLRFAQRALGSARLEPAPDGGYRPGFAAAPAADALLGPVAWSMLEVLEEGRFERLKECPGCGWLFRDRSKNNSRRWCDMATCGNLAKGRRHRARR